MRRARFVARARQEFLAEVTYYNEAEPGLGQHFTEAVERAVVRATAFPESGAPSAGNTRRVLIRDFPFSVYYRPDKNGIVVFAVAHHARRPGYWHSRAGRR